MSVLNALGNSQIFPKGTVTLESSGHTGETPPSPDQADSPILGYKACEQLKRVKRINIRTCVPKKCALTKQHIEQEYADVFKGVGQYFFFFTIIIQGFTIQYVLPGRHSVNVIEIYVECMQIHEYICI